MYVVQCTQCKHTLVTISYKIVTLAEVGIPKRYDSYELEELNELKTDVEALYAHGGGDCPELGMEGILRALSLSNENSHIIVLTDATSLDYDKKDDVISTAQLLNVKVHFFFSNDYGCYGDGFPHYTEVQTATGGVHVTSIESFSSLSLFITELDSTASKRSIRSTDFYSSDTCQTFNISIFTIKFELVIRQNSAYVEIYDPLGHNVENRHISDDLTGYVSNKNPRTGCWRICEKTPSEFTLTKKDILDFSVDFYQDGHYSSAIPMAGMQVAMHTHTHTQHTYIYVHNYVSKCISDEW